MPRTASGDGNRAASRSSGSGRATDTSERTGPAGGQRAPARPPRRRASRPARPGSPAEHSCPEPRRAHRHPGRGPRLAPVGWPRVVSDPHPAPAHAQPTPGHVQGGDDRRERVLVSSSSFLVAALIAVIVAPLAERLAGLGPWKYVAGVAFAVILYMSVLLHEASHALMARHYGFQVSSITLHFLGKHDRDRGQGPQARQEFMIRGGRTAHVDPGGRRLAPGCGPWPPTACSRRPWAPWRHEPVRGRAEPDPGSAPRRWPGAQGDRLAGHRQHAPRHHRRRLGWTARGGDRARLAPCSWSRSATPSPS